MEPEVGRVICIGGAAVDRKYRACAPIRPGTSNPVTSERSFGGVARNVAETLARLGLKVSLASVLGSDDNGRALLEDLERLGIDTKPMTVCDDHATAEYVAVLQPDGELALGLANMAILDRLTPALLRGILSDAGSAWLFADCNLPSETLHALVAFARQHSVMLALDAVSTPKVMRLPRDLTGVGTLFLNLDEARAFMIQPEAAAEDAAGALLACGAERVVLTLGADGLLAADPRGIERIAAVSARIVDATGAGDSLIATTLAALGKGCSLPDAARLGTAAAALTVESPASVRPDLSFALLEATLSLRAGAGFEREPS
ncbi:carbohydrate kinase family protein [Microvirga arsenatis]|uniref:Carbohydrate kinase n=1 Tax=Microvirga arsenatis TaxID=2692265 RepID=A0ABW9Z1V4_9HYPH|nr:carbohydrate kinase family protein [Microvirga arsenatis]NBJ13385.1 carbohydrate kinase [Microvirga arsenatis]NBJ26420.1 carbohydrate kinase [Microvirga arsenatis]